MATIVTRAGKGEALTWVEGDANFVNLNNDINTINNAWHRLVTSWDTPPTLNATISSGAVYNYTLGGVTRYRLVPEPYVAANDAFYTGFDTTTLSGLIAARGE